MSTLACFPSRPRVLAAALLAGLLALAGRAHAQPNILQPGDALIASSANSPGSEGVANAIDGQPTKYLNFDTRTGGSPSGFIVTPSVGVTRVTGISLQSANDGPERDPKIITIEGSNDETVTAFNAGTWDLIVRIDNVPPFAARFETQALTFTNLTAYKHYRFTVLETQTINACCFQIAEVGLLGALLPQDVTQPGDPLIASSANSPGSEGVANIIDGQPTKYLNFDTRTGGSPSGFIVSPSIGRTLITGITIRSANDAPDRDPKILTIEGSNDDTVTAFDAGTWELIQRYDSLPPWTARFQKQTFLFDNVRPYRHYRVTVIETQTINACCFQAAEMELLGTGAPQDVTQPGDPLIASSANSPGSEGVANIIDGQPTKYLNFDTRTGGTPSGFVVTPSIGATTIIGVTMQSANDAPDRDPRIVTIEGSNDDTISAFNSGTWELITRFDDLPPWTARFQTQEFFFANTRSYKHYRFTVIETQTVNACCFQMAEVELLAVTASVDCNQARFLAQPADTPVLPGAQATFTAGVNGPWPLQWRVNGAVIPGATAASYTTPPVTADSSTNVYTVEIVGCEVSSPARAVLFTPSATKSIGINFRGGGANGAPTLALTNDVAGVHPQAYWNNAASVGTGDLPDFTADPPIDLVDSDNTLSTITVTWTTSGTWGSGTGDASATGRILNGLNYANPGAPATITFNNVPAGSHAVLVYLVGSPLVFQDANYRITGLTEQNYYVRVLNADEYNAAPGFYRGISTNPASRSLATSVRFDNGQPDAGGAITLTWETVTTGFDRGAPVNAVQLVLNAPPAGAPPVITLNPQPTVAPTNGVATLSVTATGDNLTYQWRKNGRNLPDGGNVSGARTATLSIRDFSGTDAGVYSVAIFNPGGSTVSRNASVRLSEYDINDELVSYWKLDETAGTTATNAAVGGRPGEVTGTPTWAAGKVANAFSFDGATHMFVSNYPTATREIAVSTWVNVAAAPAGPVAFIRNAQGALGVGVGVAPNTPAGQFEVGLVYDDVTGLARLSAAIGAGPNIVRATAPAEFTYGSWQHVAASADGAQLRLYLNGVEVASTDYITAINPPDIPYLSIGARLILDVDGGAGIIPDPTTPSYLGGLLDDVGLWRRGLSAEEVQKIYAAGNQGQPLTSVVIDPPAGGGTLTIGRSQNTLSIAWTAGRLQSAASVAGPWADVTGATSPYTESPTGDAKFYRTISP